jgi:hypothetical protein
MHFYKFNMIKTTNPIVNGDYLLYTNEFITCWLMNLDKFNMVKVVNP